MNELKVFENENFGSVRVVEEEVSRYFAVLMWRGLWAMPSRRTRLQRIARVP